MVKTRAMSAKTKEIVAAAPAVKAAKKRLRAAKKGVKAAKKRENKAKANKDKVEKEVKKRVYKYRYRPYVGTCKTKQDEVRAGWWRLPMKPRRCIKVGSEAKDPTAWMFKRLFEKPKSLKSCKGRNKRQGWIQPDTGVCISNQRLHNWLDRYKTSRKAYVYAGRAAT